MKLEPVPEEAAAVVDRAYPLLVAICGTELTLLIFAYARDHARLFPVVAKERKLRLDNRAFTAFCRCNGVVLLPGDLVRLHRAGVKVAECDSSKQKLYVVVRSRRDPMTLVQIKHRAIEDREFSKLVDFPLDFWTHPYCDATTGANQRWCLSLFIDGSKMCFILP